MILYENKTKLRECLSFVLQSPHSDFYRKHLEGSTEESSLETLPFLSRSTLASVHPSKRSYVTPEHIRFVAATSGTTSGHPLLLFFTDIDSYHIDPAWGTSVRRPLIVFPPLNKNFGGTFIQQCAQAPQPLTPVFGDLQNMASSAVLAAEMECDALYVTPSYAFALEPELKRYYDPEQIKLLVISGETIGESKLASLRYLYPKARIANLYASSEIGQFIMGPTPAMVADNELGFYPLTDALVALELIENELVITYGLNKALPLIRYRTGDTFEIDEQRTQKYGQDDVPVLQWAGKGGVDVVRTHGLEFRAGSVDDFFATLTVPVSLYQLHIRPGSTSTQVSVEIEVVLHSSQNTEVCSVIKDSFLNNFIVDKLGVVHDAMIRGVIESFTITPVVEVSYKSKKRRVLVNHLK